MIVRIGGQDPRYCALLQGHNLRWPASPSEQPAVIELCESTDDVAAALQKIVDDGRRPTIRSGGHCYEDFVVNNPGGTIIDLSLLIAPHAAGEPGRYRISAGRKLGDAYQDLYKRDGVTLPAGSCYTVGAGGHISGGGYGVLSRLYGLTVDWLSAVEIVTVNASGKVQIQHVDRSHNPDLFRACRGAGGGNFGVITAYFFDNLPTAPRDVVVGGIAFDWDKMTESRFVDLVQRYGDYWATRGRDRDTWGLFAIFDLSHKTSGRLSLYFQFCNLDGTCHDLSVLSDFLNRFEACGGSTIHLSLKEGRVVENDAPGKSVCMGRHELALKSWLDATLSEGGGYRGTRGKYKSAHMKDNFSTTEAKVIYKHLTRTVEGVDLRRSTFAVDSFGGAVNRPTLKNETSSYQRESIMKLQFLTFWEDAKDDAGIVQWMREFYTELYSNAEVPQKHAGTPFPGKRYEGCYINYPDEDMLAYPFWPQLYYGAGELYPFLQSVKERYDPHNVFHHAMSIRPKSS